MTGSRQQGPQKMCSLKGRAPSKAGKSPDCRADRAGPTQALLRLMPVVRGVRGLRGRFESIYCALAVNDWGLRKRSLRHP